MCTAAVLPFLAGVTGVGDVTIGLEKAARGWLSKYVDERLGLFLFTRTMTKF